MKEMRLSFDINLALKQFDVHWIEDQLLHLREEVFLDILRRILREIEAVTVGVIVNARDVGRCL